MQHRGIAVDDPRNAGVIAFFAPKKITRESVTDMLTTVRPGMAPAELATLRFAATPA